MGCLQISMIFTTLKLQDTHSPCMMSVLWLLTVTTINNFSTVFYEAGQIRRTIFDWFVDCLIVSFICWFAELYDVTDNLDIRFERRRWVLPGRDGGQARSGTVQHGVWSPCRQSGDRRETSKGEHDPSTASSRTWSIQTICRRQTGPLISPLSSRLTMLL